MFTDTDGNQWDTQEEADASNEQIAFANEGTFKDLAGNVWTSQAEADASNETINAGTGPENQDVTEIPNTAKEGEEGAGWKYYTDGTSISPKGVYYNSEMPGGSFDTSTLEPGVIAKIKAAYSNADGSINWGQVFKTAAPLLGGALAVSSNNSAGGQGTAAYQGGIPSLTASRTMNPIPAGKRPGAGGITHFTPMQYAGNRNMAPGPGGGTAGSTTTPGTGTGTIGGGSGGIATPGTSTAPAPTAQAPSSGGISSIPRTSSGPKEAYRNLNAPLPKSSGEAGMWVNGTWLAADKIHEFYKSGADDREWLQKFGITDMGEIHRLANQARAIAGPDSPINEAALQKEFKIYQKYNPNGKYANDYAGWTNDQDPARINAMWGGSYTGPSTAGADWGFEGIYGPGSAYYGQPGYGQGLGPRGMGTLGGGWDTVGAATGATSQLTAAQQQQIASAASKGLPLPKFATTPAVSNAQIMEAYNAHKNDPTAAKQLVDAMKQYGLTSGQLIDAGVPASFVNSSTGTQSIPAAQIMAEYNLHKNDPTAQAQLVNAMQKYGLTSGQLTAAGIPAAFINSASQAPTQQAAAVPAWQSYLTANSDLGAAGFDTQAEAQQHWNQFGQYENRQAGLGSPAPAPAPAPAAPQGVSNADISSFYQQNANNPEAIKAAMAQYGVTADQAAAATGQNASMFQFAKGGGISALPGAAASQRGRFLRGAGDGVSDSIPARINGQQEAALADNEFVIPARAVSEIGNGSSEAGARKLYAMLDRIEKTRHTNKNTAKDTHADRHLPV